MENTPPANAALPVWIAAKGAGARNFYPCHTENFPYEDVLQLFAARSTKFQATMGRPHGGRFFRLSLPSSRHALLTQYDDFPHSVEISLELDSTIEEKDVAHLSDLASILHLLGIPLPDTSNIGFPNWR